MTGRAGRGRDDRGPTGRRGLRRLFRLSGLRRRDSVREVDDEVLMHVELRAAELVRSGLDREAAREEARRLFAVDEGTMDALYAAAVERDRRVRARQRIEGLLQDAP